MADMISGLINSFGGPVLEDLGKRFGLPPQMVKTATPMAIGLVLAGVKRMSANPGGKDAVAAMMDSASQRVGDRSLDAFIQEADPSKTGAMLDSLTGTNATEQVLANLARKTGLDPEMTGKFLGVMAPAVMSQLGSVAKDQNLDVDGVVNLIDQGAETMKGIGDLDYILDDVPGISDDLKRGLSKLFGG